MFRSDSKSDDISCKVDYEDVENNTGTSFIDMDTVLDDPEHIENALQCKIPSNSELTFAVGEGHVPLSIFHYENAEYLAFSKISSCKKYPENQQYVYTRVTYVNISYTLLIKMYTSHSLS